jgi:hypothetical protein
MEVVVWGSEVLLLAPLQTEEEEQGQEEEEVGRARKVAAGTPALKVSFRFLPPSLLFFLHLFLFLPWAGPPCGRMACNRCLARGVGSV